MTETAYGFAVRTLKDDPDVKAIVRCGECYGTGEIVEFESRHNRGLVDDVEIRNPCHWCGRTGCERIERWSEQPEDPQFCYGESRCRVTLSHN